jgi:hypothetical protein
LEPNHADVRLVVALDAVTGENRWQKPLDLTGCGGDKMGAAYQDGVLLFFGSFSNHDGGLFREGSLKFRRITAVSAENGEVLWSRPLNYLRRPVVVGDTIIIEPRACDLRTGKIKTRSHPITGEQVPWEFLRPGHSCSITSAAPNLLSYRSYNFAFYDLVEDRGLAYFGAIRPGCWLSLIHANGLMLAPEASSGCTCSFPLRCSVALTHKQRKRPREWTVFITHGSMTPAKHFAINFGAPGDMRDDQGILWFGYPRPQVGYGVKFNLNGEVLPGMGYFCHDFKGARVEGSDRPWLFTSGCLGLRRCEVPLIDETWEEAPAVYTVHLGFMAPSGERPNRRVFDVKLQGDTVLKDFDIVQNAGAPNKAVIKEFKGIKVENDLTVELVPKTPNPDLSHAPIINFIEAIREDVGGIAESPESPETFEKRDVRTLVEMAKFELDRKNYESALQIYHAVLDVNPAPAFKHQALDGMAVIGSPKSLSRIAKYCRDVSPILAEYKEPDLQFRDRAARVYVAIANNVAKADKRRAIKMFNHALTITNTPDIRRGVITSVENLGFEVGAEAAKAGYITHWHLIGPFPWDYGKNTLKTALDEVSVNEPSVSLDGSYQARGKTLKWEEYVSDREMIDLENLFDPRTHVSVYAYAEVILPEDQELFLKIGSDDAFKCWWCGEEAGRFDGDRSWAPDQDILRVRGKKGVNTLLLKISQGSAEWAFSARLTDTRDKPLRYPRR